MIDSLQRWLQSGAEVREGLRLLTLYAPNKHLHKLVELRPDVYQPLLVKTLSALLPKTTSRPVATPRLSFRQQWSFLNNEDCPNELKILAADKITAYGNYVSAHLELFDCVDTQECFAVAKKVVENFIENRKIFSELTYYKEHKSVLGKHPIFNEINRLNGLRRLSVVELFRRKENLEESIWRIRNEINKGDKPHLQTSRESRLKKKQRELSEVNRIISGYN